MTEDGISSVLSSTSPKLLLSTRHISASGAVLMSGNSATSLGATIQNLAAGSCAFCIWGNDLLVSQHLLVFSTCSHLSAPLHPMEAGNLSSSY